MSTVIVSCTALQGYLEKAQAKEGTDFPIVYIDRKYHMDPRKMQEKVVEAVRDLPEDCDTVLLAMGLCGGSLHKVTFERRTVIPRIDDCISIMLQRENRFVPDLKKMGHMYMMEIDPETFDMTRSFSNLDIDEDEFDDELYEMMFGNYRYLDIVDTGLNNCHSEAYVAKAKENAAVMKVDIEYVEGSNHLLEKLIGGRWDEQFIIAESGRVVVQDEFWSV